MLYKYLTNNYKVNEPIFLSDIHLPVSDGNLRQMFKGLCDSDKIKRFETGIYYLPKESRLKEGVPLDSDTVAKYKYISRSGKIDGYYSGYTFANQLGVTTQVPYVLEIVSNHASAKVREVKLRNRRIILRKSKFLITNENYKILQFLDFLKDINLYTECSEIDLSKKVRKYIKKEKIKKSDIDLYIKDYPDRIFRTIYEMRLYEVFA